MKCACTAPTYVHTFIYTCRYIGPIHAYIKYKLGLHMYTHNYIYKELRELLLMFCCGKGVYMAWPILIPLRDALKGLQC